jgi:WD40 repeat protein
MGINDNITHISTDLSKISGIIRKYYGPIDEIRTILISTSSQWMYSGSRDHLIMKYSLENPVFSRDDEQNQKAVQIATLTGHTGSITLLQEIWDGKLITSSSKDGMIKIWSMTSDKCVYSFQTGHGSVFTFDFIKLGKNRTIIITGGEDGYFRIWNLFFQIRNGKFILSHRLIQQHRVEFNAPVHTVKIHRKLPLFACAGDSNRILIYSISNGEKLRDFVLHRKFVYTLDFHPIEPWVLSAGKEKKINLTDIDKGVIFEIQVPKSISYLKFSSRGGFFLSVGFNNDIRIYNTHKGKVIHNFSWQVGTKLTIGIDKEWKLLAISPFSHGSPQIRLWDFSKILPISADIVGENSRA